MNHRKVSMARGTRGKAAAERADDRTAKRFRSSDEFRLAISMRPTRTGKRVLLRRHALLRQSKHTSRFVITFD